MSSWQRDLLEWGVVEEKNMRIARTDEGVSDAIMLWGLFLIHLLIRMRLAWWRALMRKGDVRAFCTMVM